MSVGRGSLPPTAWLLAGLLLCACSKETTSPKPDATPPGAVLDLQATSATRSGVTLHWTATGDDGIAGRATTYDVRYSPGPIDTAGWFTASQIDGEQAPRVAGQAESLMIEGLQAGRTYRFAMRAADEIPNWSALSNVAVLATVPPDTIPPARVADLRVIAADEGGLTLAWTDTGDDSMNGRAFFYRIRMSATPIIDEATWEEAVSAYGNQPDAPGDSDSCTIPHLSAATTYYFAIRITDGIGGNWSPLSNCVGGTTTPAIPPATVTDLGVLATTENSVILGWTEVGDDGMAGTAWEYEVRFSTSPIDESNWDQAIHVCCARSPRAPGETETFKARGIAIGRTFYAALQVCDDVGACSGLSNVVSVHLVDTIAPFPVIDLRVTTGRDPSVVVATWTAVSNDGDSYEPGTVYDLRYAAEPITDESWPNATPVLDLPAPRGPGVFEKLTIPSLGIDRHYFAVKVGDETGNWSPLSNVAAGIVPLRLEAEDLVASGNSGGGPIEAQACPSASGGATLDGVDSDGDWIQLGFTLTMRTCVSDSLISAGEAANIRRFAIQFLRGPAGPVVASDTLATIPGSGTSCRYVNYDGVGSSRKICLDAGDYLARIERIGGEGVRTRIDCLDLRNAAP